MYRSRDDKGKSLDLSTGITKEDHKKISALDLIMHYSQQRHEAIWETNALIRYFLSQRNLQAANYAFCKVSCNLFTLLPALIFFNDDLFFRSPRIRST